MKFNLAIFDMDGTILDTLEDLKNSLNVILNKYEYPQRSLEEVRKFVGNGILRLIEQAIPDECGEMQVRMVYEDFVPYYKEHSAEKQDLMMVLCNCLQN